jgi:uncharacterized OB-fold protein
VSGIRYWRERDADQRLVAHECRDCGWVSYPEQKRVCKACASAPADFEPVQLREEGEIRTFVVQERLPEEFETPQPVAIVDLPQEGEGEPARVYGLLTETAREELSVGATVEARFRELFTTGERPVHGFKFAVPRSERASRDEAATGGGDPR